MRRFEREALATARLKSVHTISIYDFGITDQGAFYYVMELLDGLDLASLVKRFGPVPASRAVRILRQCCHSLGEAHACSLVHRDIKPANIFLCRLGPDHDFVKILDFGLVKTDSGAGAGDLTQKGVTFGTPDFMAPEMAVGRDGVDGRADIYSLGCVAYWLLTGQRVFGDGSAMQVVVDHVKTDPPPPSSRTELPIPLELDAIVLSCLAKDPASRPQTAGELARRLAGVPAGRDWDESRAAAWWNLHVPAPTDDETPATPTPASAAD
jgi:serine/threonine protein kinase